MHESNKILHIFTLHTGGSVMILVNLVNVGMVPTELHRSHAVCSNSRLDFIQSTYMMLPESAASISTKLADCGMD